MLAHVFKKCQDCAPLFMRLMLAAVFIFHGYQKATDLDMTTGFLTTLKFPAPAFFAVVLVIAELGGGILLLLGLFTRYAAAVIAITMLVAVITVGLPNGFDLAKGGFEYPLTLFVMAVAVMILGGGKLSLEKCLFKKEF